MLPALQIYPDLTALVVFQKYQPAEVLLLAREGELLPTGLTRHLIQGRALRVNFPLKLLASHTDLAEKKHALQEWIKSKMATREVRYYGEKTFLFDE